MDRNGIELPEVRREQIEPPKPELLAACQVRIEWVPSDPSQVYVYPIPDYCAASLHVALAAMLAALLKAGFVIR